MDRVVDQDDGRLTDAVRAAAYHGRVKVLLLLLDKGTNTTVLLREESKYGNALQVIVVAYHSTGEVLRLLLDKSDSANANALGGQYGGALQASALMGKVEIVRLTGSCADVRVKVRQRIASCSK